MKAIIYLLVILALVFSKTIDINDTTLDETRGCTIKEKEGRCCWLNNNGCCQPPKPGQMCTMALKTCCKTKTYDKETDTYTYTYN